MKISNIKIIPEKKSYDVVIIGGAFIGTAVASFLSLNKDFSGSILVIEKDWTFQFSASAYSNDCIRQQFATEMNIKIAQVGADYIKIFAGSWEGIQKYLSYPLQILAISTYRITANSPKFYKKINKPKQN